MVAIAYCAAICGSDSRRWRAGCVVRRSVDGRVVDPEARLNVPRSDFRVPTSMYVELHCHSAFSFLDGASLPEQLALTASQLGYPALALTDHNGLYGSMAFAQEAKQLGIQAITGAELTLLDGSHVTILAETPEGYANLCRLITEGHLGREDRRDPRLGFASLGARHAGLIVLVAIRHRTTLDGSHDVRHANSEFFLRPHEEVEALFRDCPNAVANTLALAERCRGFDLTRDLGYRFPDFNGAERAPAPRALAELCRARLEERYPPDSPHRDAAERRLAEELRLVEHHKLSGFFLVYHDLFDLARQVAA